MLGGKISNQDEDEVEDELDALEAELTGVPMPNVPTARLPNMVPNVPTTDLSSKERAKARREREAREEGRVAMLA
jgi:charged multivesicular body protein 6